MSKTIQHKRSSVAGNQPNNTQVDVGELGLNFPDRSIYTKDGLGVITELARDVWRTDTAPDSALDGDMWYDTSSGTISIWDGSDWGEITTGGKPVEPDQITSEPPFTEGSGTENDPYVLEPVFANVGDVDVHIGTFTITGLNEGQIVNAVDNNGDTNGSRFKSTNNIADADGTLTFRAYFEDNPETASATTYEGEFKIGSNSIYVNCSVALQKVLEGGTEIPDNVPDGVGGNGPFIWQGSDGRTLTATFPLLISKDGGYFTDEITVDNGDQIWLKWAGDPGSGVGIDEPHGTTIVGTLSDGLGGSHQCSFTIDKETSFVFHNFVDSDQTIGGLSESRVVTVRDVNSYVYPFGTTTGDSAQYVINGGDWQDIPSTNTGSATHYMVEGDEFQLRHRDAATSNTASTYNFNMAGDSADWTTVTADIDPIIKQPEIESPATDGATGIGTSGPFVSSDFEMASGVDTHTASSWEMFSEAWTNQPDFNSTLGAARDMYSITSDGSQFVAVGNSGKCVTSPDGVTWTNQSAFTSLVGSTPNDYMNSIVWSGTQFVAVGRSGKCVKSTNGSTWTKDDPTGQNSLYAAAGAVNWNAIAWSGSEFCAVGDNGVCATSPDGINWTSRPSLATETSNAGFNAIVWGDTQFVAVGRSGRCATSPDGVTWTNQTGTFSTAVSGQHAYSIAWDGNQFCATAHSFKVATSPDGVTWTTQSGLPNTLYSIIWDGTRFLGVGHAGTYASSPDGVTWSTEPDLASASGGNTMTSVAWNGTVACAVGNQGQAATLERADEQSLDSDTSALISWTPSTTLDYKTDYKVRVRHHTATLNSEWSDYRSFETKGLPGSTERWNYDGSLSNFINSNTNKNHSWEYHPNINALFLRMDDHFTHPENSQILKGLYYSDTDDGKNFQFTGRLNINSVEYDPYGGTKDQSFESIVISDAGHVYLEVDEGDSKWRLYKSNETVSSASDLSNLTWTQQAGYKNQYDLLSSQTSKKGKSPAIIMKGNSGVALFPSEEHLIWSNDVASDSWSKKYLGTSKMYVKYLTSGPNEGDFIAFDAKCNYFYRKEGSGTNWTNIANTVKAALGTISTVVGMHYLESAGVLGLMYRSGSTKKFATSTDFGNTWTDQPQFGLAVNSVPGWNTLLAPQTQGISTINQFVWHANDLNNLSKIGLVTSPDGVNWTVSMGPQTTFSGLGLSFWSGTPETIVGSYRVGSGSSQSFQVYNSDH